MQVDGTHAGTARPLGRLADKTFHRLGRARYQRLHRAVGPVAHPAVQLVLLRRHHQKVAESHTLDKTVHMYTQGRNIFTHAILRRLPGHGLT